MKKLLVLVAAFTFVGQTFSAFRFENPFKGFLKPLEAEVVVKEQAILAQDSCSKAGLIAKVKTFQEQVLAKAETFISSNPKMAVAYTVLATLVAEQVISLVYNNLTVSDDADEDDEDLDIA